MAHVKDNKGTQSDLVLMDGDQYKKAQPLCTKVGELSMFADILNVEGVTFRQTGSDRKFDWSRAELRFYE